MDQELELDQERYKFLEELIAESDNAELSFLYTSIIESIKENKKDIDTPIHHHHQVDDDDEWVTEYSTDGNLYNEVKKLVAQLQEANKELRFDYCKKIDIRLLNLISKLFPYKTDKILAGLEYRVAGTLKTNNEMMFSLKGIDELKIIQEMYNRYIYLLRIRAKQLGEPYLQKDLFENNIPISTQKTITQELSDFKDTQHDLVSKVEELEDILDIDTIDKIVKNIKEKKQELDNTFSKTKETAEKITADYKTFTEQWVVKDFKTKVDSLLHDQKIYARLFILMIIIDIGVIIGCVFLNMWGLPKLFGTGTLSFWEHFSAGILLTTPILATLYWLTRYFNRRAHELVHLKEDYEHKYLSMLVFDGFKETVSSYGEKASYEYLMKVINTITENPTHCLSRKKADKIPTTEIAELIKAIHPFILQPKKE